MASSLRRPRRAWSTVGPVPRSAPALYGPSRTPPLLDPPRPPAKLSRNSLQMLLDHLLGGHLWRPPGRCLDRGSMSTWSEFRDSLGGPRKGAEEGAGSGRVGIEKVHFVAEIKHRPQDRQLEIHSSLLIPPTELSLRLHNSALIPPHELSVRPERDAI